MGIMEVGVMYLYFRNTSSDTKFQSMHTTHNTLNLSERFRFLFGCLRPGPRIGILRYCISVEIRRYL